MQPWYITPAALAIIEQAQTRPAIEHHERAYVLTKDYWSLYAGPEVDALTDLWQSAFVAANNAIDRDPAYCAAILTSGSQDIFGALFGDPDATFGQTERDLSEGWAAIRGALSVRVAA
jgi:hypothetical protein